MVHYRAPGVYREDVYPSPEPSLSTGVPVFAGYTVRGAFNAARRLTMWPQFATEFGGAPADGYLDDAVQGFFDNGGLVCYVVRLNEAELPLLALSHGLAATAELNEVDLVCAPDVMRGISLVDEPDPGVVIGLQAEVLAHCRLVGGRFAILDGVPTADLELVERQRAALHGEDGALYFPWLWTPGRAREPAYLPPCGHLAGVYARTDRSVGVHKAPANEVLQGVLDLRTDLGVDAVGRLFDAGINCLRAQPGRGIRVWGARTLSDDTAWRQIGARRVFLTVRRWLERFMDRLTYEPNDVRLWVRIMRETAGYLDDLFQSGALHGRSPDEAFFVKCDGETNDRSTVDAGSVVTLVGLALSAPAEFVVARIVHGATGVTVHPASATV
ncbi:MAG TPA: phage tail sheath subtilisin-like domain-containing protein [Actinoplanes sp.]|nr:phage tail sheath subtilisin-like domain-containing protein [Actinoplanes sp.]